MNRQVAVLTLSYFCYGYVAYIFFTWFFKYLSEVRGLNLKSSALYATLPFIAMAVASSLGGWVSDKLVVNVGKRVGRCGVAGISLLAASIFVWTATQVEDARLAALVLAGGARGLVLRSECVLGLKRRHRRAIRRPCFRDHEYGLPNRRGLYGGVDPRHCRHLWLDGLIPRRRCCMSRRGYRVDIRQPFLCARTALEVTFQHLHFSVSGCNRSNETHLDDSNAGIDLLIPVRRVRRDDHHIALS